MTYWDVNFIFLGLAALVLIVAVVLRKPGPLFWGALGASTVLLFVLTAVFDNLMIAAGIMTYTDQNISGVQVGLAPLEDFAIRWPGCFCCRGCGCCWVVGWILTGPRGVLPKVFPQKASRALTRIAVPTMTTPREMRDEQTVLGIPAAELGQHRLSVHRSGIADRGTAWWLVVLGTVFFLVPYNLAMYGINDVFDYESDLRNPRKGGVEGAVVDRSARRSVLLASCLVPAPFVLVLVGWAVMTGNLLSIAVLAVSLFAVVAYSWAGLRFKEKPFLDAVTSSTHFVSPAVYGLVLAGADFTLGLWGLLAGFFLWGMASQMFGAVQDVVPDRDGGLASVATVLGARPRCGCPPRCMPAPGC